jgi:hypothetical protein
MDELLIRGIAELRRFLGDAAYQLQNATRKGNEIAAFSLDLPPDYQGVSRTLRISFPKNFPSLTLDFSITPSAVQIWPHVMRYGVCLYGPNQIPAKSTPEEAVNSAMSRLWQLISFALEGSDPKAREAEFAREVRSYWASQFKESPNRFALVRLPEASCPLFVVSANSTNPFKTNQYIGAEKYKDISKFENRYKRSFSKQKGTAKPAYFLKLASTPSNIIEENLLEWLESHVDPKDFLELKSWFDTSSELPMRWLILSLPTDVTALQGFVLTEPNVDLTKRHATLYGRKTIKRKFHSTKVNLNLRFAPIDVLDAAVIHQRAGEASSGLSNKRVVVVGAGSLGGDVAVLLARSGVGHLYLIDYDTLEDVNIGRHTLGATDLGKYKVEALADRICMDVPTAEVNYSNEILQRGGKAQEKALMEADLVIVTTANWGSEAYLWDLKSSGANWALIQAWSEPHGIVGHILTTPSGGNHDARYLFEEGRFVKKMSEWPGGGVYALPACGGSYIPGGPVALARIAGQTVQKALDQLINPKSNPEWHVLIGNPKKISDYGGTYNGPTLPFDVESCEFCYPWPTNGA